MILSVGINAYNDQFGGDNRKKAVTFYGAVGHYLGVINLGPTAPPVAIKITKTVQVKWPDGRPVEIIVSGKH
jgi:hypothetical protein